MCAVFVSSFSCVICWRRGVSFSLTRYARPFVSFLFSSPHLVGRLVAILCGSLVGSYRLLVSSGGSSLRLACRSSVFRLVRLIVTRLVSSSRPLVSSSSSYSLVSPGGSSWRFVVSGSVFRLVLFCSRRISLVASHVHGGGSSFVVSFRSSRGCVFLSLLSSVIVGRGDGGVSVPFDDTKDAPFSSARFLIG